MLSSPQLQVAQSLNYLLADYEIYLHKLLRFQWKIQASERPEMNELLDEYTDDVEQQIDNIVGRVMKLEQTPVSTLANWMRKSKLTYKTDIESSDRIINQVLEDSQSLENTAYNLNQQATQANDAPTAALAQRIQNRNAKRVNRLLQFVRINTPKKKAATL